MDTTFNAVCSNKLRPSVQGGSGMNKTGACLWGRDLFHAAGIGGRTLCGVRSADWLTIGPMNTDKAMADGNFRKRCAAKLR